MSTAIERRRSEHGYERSAGQDRHSEDLDIERRKAQIVEIYQGAAMDEQIDKMMEATSAQ